MVKVRVSKKYHDYIDFQTVSLEYGHSQHFLLSWHDFEKLDRGEDVIAKSLQREDGATPCKAYFYRKAWAGELAVSFFWRDERRIKYNEDGSEDNEYGSEHVLLPYDDLYAFIREQSWSGAPSEWKCLALEESKQSRLVFVEKRNLRKCLSNKLIRKKLVRFLRDRFCDPDVPQVNFYDRLPSRISATPRSGLWGRSPCSMRTIWKRRVFALRAEKSRTPEAWIYSAISYALKGGLADG